MNQLLKPFTWTLIVEFLASTILAHQPKDFGLLSVIRGIAIKVPLPGLGCLASMYVIKM